MGPYGRAQPPASLGGTTLPSSLFGLESLIRSRGQNLMHSQLGPTGTVGPTPSMLPPALLALLASRGLTPPNLPTARPVRRPAIKRGRPVPPAIPGSKARAQRRQARKAY